MTAFPILLMAVLALWAVLATVLALVWGRSLRREREEHDGAREQNETYRAAVLRLKERAANLVAQYEALQHEHLALRASAERSEQAPAEPAVPMLMVDSLDISGEVGTLFEHVARVARAVREYSAYTRGHYGAEHNKARYDLLWLADCLHTFDQIGKALATGSQRSLSAACTELASMYDAYPRESSGYDSRDTFRRLAERVPLGGVTDAARSIVMKTAAAPAAVDARPAPARVVVGPVLVAGNG